MIEKTTDYSIFKTIKGNRTLKQGHLADLATSILKKNMLAENPIIVNSKMQVIDGQHRLEVAKENNLPVYYIVLADSSIDEVQQLNQTNMPWKAQDYLESFAVRGNDNYIWIREFMKDHSISLTTALILAQGTDGEWMYRSVKKGELEISQQQRDQANLRMKVLEKVRLFDKRKGHLPKYFVRAIVKIDEDGLLLKLLKGAETNGKTFVSAANADEARDQLLAFI